jgi:hypothetical protein
MVASDLNPHAKSILAVTLLLGHLWLKVNSSNRTMCVGAEKDMLMARVGPDIYEKVLKKTALRYGFHWQAT